MAHEDVYNQGKEEKSMFEMFYFLFWFILSLVFFIICSMLILKIFSAILAFVFLSFTVSETLNYFK